jgi:hypothetical protein
MERRRISSSIGGVSAGSMHEGFTIPDETENYQRPIRRDTYQDELVNSKMEIDEAERHRLQNLKKQIKTEQEKVKPNSISRLEILSGIGRLTMEKEIGGVNFKLRSLKNRELKEVLHYLTGIESKIDEIFALKNATLAYSIYEIDGKEFWQYCINDSLEEKIAIIEELDDFVVDELWKFYSKTKEDYGKKFNEDLGKDPKEIHDTIKK